MSANTVAAGSAKDKASQEATAPKVQSNTAEEQWEETRELMVDFIRGSKGDNFRLLGNLRALPWMDDAFMLNVAKCAFTSLVHRSKEGKSDFPANGGNVAMEVFEKAIRAVVFRGDEKPNADDEKFATTVMNSVASGAYTAEAAASAIEANPEYGWKISPDKAGFALHSMYKRLKEAAAKPATPGIADL